LGLSTSEALHICLTVDSKNADIFKKPITLVNNQCII
jgi:hypothetical protein